ncbi:MAG: DsrE family protein [Nitrospiria bacterium]
MKNKKLGIILSTPPEENNLSVVISLAEEACRQSVHIYLYLIDDGVKHIDLPEIQILKEAGVKLSLCAYSAQRRSIPSSDKAVFGGLVVLSDLIKGCDRLITL